MDFYAAAQTEQARTEGYGKVSIMSLNEKKNNNPSGSEQWYKLSHLFFKGHVSHAYFACIYTKNYLDGYIIC